MSHALSETAKAERFEGEYLFALARDRSTPARRALVEAVTEMPSSHDDAVTQRERKLMFDILRRLVHEAEMAVRRTVSQRLAEMPDAPRDLVRLLANDKIEIAFPILTKSRVLEDEDLVEIVKNRTFEHQLAVAIRSDLSETVSDSLVDTGDRNVIKCLLQNSHAKVSRATMEYLVDQSEREDIFREPLIRRKDLDRDLAERMYLWVSDALRQIIVDDWNLDEDTVNRLIRDAKQREWKAERTNPTPMNKAQSLAEKLDEQGLLNPEALLRVLRNGDVALFLAMFARLTGLSDAFVKRILFDPNGKALALACRFAGLDRDGFREIFAFVRKARPSAPRARVSEADALGYFGRTSAEGAREIVRNWRNHPNPAGMWDLGVA